MLHIVSKYIEGTQYMLIQSTVLDPVQRLKKKKRLSLFPIVIYDLRKTGNREVIFEVVYGE